MAADLVLVFKVVLNTNYIIGHMWSHLGCPPVSKHCFPYYSIHAGVQVVQGLKIKKYFNAFNSCTSILVSNDLITFIRGITHRKTQRNCTALFLENMVSASALSSCSHGMQQLDILANGNITTVGVWKNANPAAAYSLKIFFLNEKESKVSKKEGNTHRRWRYSFVLCTRSTNVLESYLAITSV